MTLTAEVKKYWEENMSQCYLVHQKSCMNWPGIESGPLLWRTGTLPPGTITRHFCEELCNFLGFLWFYKIKQLLGQRICGVRWQCWTVTELRFPYRIQLSLASAHKEIHFPKTFFYYYFESEGGKKINMQNPTTFKSQYSRYKNVFIVVFPAGFMLVRIYRVIHKSVKHFKN